MALPTTTLLGFSPPLVKAGRVVLPVCIDTGLHGLGMSVPVAREIAQALLDATSPEAIGRKGPRTLPATAEGPILKPKGAIL